MIGRAFAAVLLAAIASSRAAGAQQNEHCSSDRAFSTLVGAGLGAAAGAIPATIVHRHDQTSSHRIVVVSISAGAVLGFVAASRDRPCTSPPNSSRIADAVMATRSQHAKRGGVIGLVTGAVVGAAGSSLYNVGCVNDPCNATRTRVGITVFSAAEGALAGGILGGLVGWAWPVRQ